MQKPETIPKSCFLKKNEKGSAVLYVALKTKRSPIAERREIRKKLNQSK